MKEIAMDFKRSGNGPDWDEEFARDIIGQSLLVGISRLSSDGELIGREQVFGEIVSVDERNGIEIKKRVDGTIFTIAPMITAIMPADPGRYELTDSDEIIDDPDFTLRLTLTEPTKN